MKTIPCWSSYLGSQHDAARCRRGRRYRSIAGTRRQQLSIDAVRTRATANQLHVAAAIGRRDRQTDGRTPDRYVDASRLKPAASENIILFATGKQLIAIFNIRLDVDQSVR